MADVLISGASVAGPAAAVALTRLGHTVTVVEIAPEPRTGGYAVDFRGKAHLDALSRLGVLDDLREVSVPATRTRFLAGPRTRLDLPEEFTGGDLNVLRRDLTRVLVTHSGDADYRYGISIREITDDRDRIGVEFTDGGTGTFDVVIGADGIHSRVRRLLFGPEEQFVTYQGYCVAGWDLPNTVGATPDLTVWNAPGKALGVSRDPQDPSRGHVFAVFEAPSLPRELRHDRHAQNTYLRHTLSQVGPLGRQLTEYLPGASDIYLDAIARADVPAWSKGRCVLLGDAAAGATLGGMGTGTAVVSAMVLADRLQHDEPVSAFRHYEELVRPYATACQRGGDTAGRFFAPRSRPGIAARNLFFGTPPGRRMLIGTGRERSEGLQLPA
ncbi:FAD-dependent monooxygenase [Microbacterium testaceum]|uniref:FAD-dependent monooxygenase n=1 Tax=Microbacterium testaceum TaxID=2033 RepID=UPI00341204CA